MTTEEMVEIVRGRQEKSKLAQNKVNDLYDSTVKLLYAIGAGKDKDWCMSHWVTLIEKLDGFGSHDREYYSRHAAGLVQLIEDYVKGAK